MTVLYIQSFLKVVPQGSVMRPALFTIIIFAFVFDDGMQSYVFWSDSTVRKPSLAPQFQLPPNPYKTVFQPPYDTFLIYDHHIIFLLLLMLLL